MLSPARRRELGAFYTPSDVADRLVALTLPDGAPMVCDPACGSGAFLLAAARHLEARGLDRTTIAVDLLWGIDLDPVAVDVARAAITEWSGVSPGDHLVVGDGLKDIGWSGRFDAVVGNPPFLNQLERSTSRTSQHRWRALTGPYADTAFLFLLAALDLVRDGGHVTLIQPQSVVAARDAGAIRVEIARRAALVGMWTCDESVFDASVRVCAPLLQKGAQPQQVRRWSGRDFGPRRAARVDGAAWSGALSRDVPTLDLDASRRLGDLVTATAGFREQFYGLVPSVVDAEKGDLPRLVTCGVIDPGRWRWPRVDVDRIESMPLRRWVRDRLVPKVVVATQTRVIEAAVDVDGSWVPSTPVIAVHASAADLHRVAAVLAAPPISAWAAGRYAGVALAPDALKLSARQVLEIPLPCDDEAWNAGAVALREGDLRAAGRSMIAAYGAGDDVFDWWAARLPSQ